LGVNERLAGFDTQIIHAFLFTRPPAEIAGFSTVRGEWRKPLSRPFASAHEAVL
jgi:hypothetical protein